MLRTASALLTAGLVLLTLSPALPAQGTFPLKYEQVDAEPHLALRLSGVMAPPLQDKPADLKAGPGNAKAPLTYFSAKLGKRDVLLALDGSSPPKLCVDVNGDKKLTDDEVFELSATKRTLLTPARRETTYGPIALSGPDQAVPVKVRVQAYQKAAALLYPSGWWTGRVKIEGKEYPIAVVDSDLNGRVGNAAAFPPSAGAEPLFDVLAFDCNGDGEMNGSYDGGEVLPLPKMLRVNNRYYDMQVAPDGTTVTLRKVEPRLGTLDVGTGGAELLLWSENGSYVLSGREGKWQLPEGRYLSMQLQISSTDKANSKWTMTSWGTTGKLRNFEIRAGEALSLEPGPPVSVATEVRRQPAMVYLSLQIQGQAGELYSMPTKDGRRLPAPKLKIVDEKGRVLATGSFEYG